MAGDFAAMEPLDKHIISHPTHDEPANSEHETPGPETEPAIEIVTRMVVTNPGVATEYGEPLQSDTIERTRQTSVIVRSKHLLRMIKDVVKFYPR